MADGDDITDLVEQFMAVTGVEDTVAMCYLQQSNWNVEVCSTLKLYTCRLLSTVLKPVQRRLIWTKID